MLILRQLLPLVCVICFCTLSVFGKCLVNMEAPERRIIENLESITLDTSRRASHKIISHIFKIYCEEVLGYSPVYISHVPASYDAKHALARLSNYNNSLPSALINLEVWASSNFEVYPTRFVRDCGPVAPPGRFGWFIPDTNYNTGPRNFDYWKYFQDDSRTKLFAIDDDNLMKKLLTLARDSSHNYYCTLKNRCVEGMFIPDLCVNNNNCALLVTSYPDETSFVQDHIVALQMYVNVLWVGPNLESAVNLLKDYYRVGNMNKKHVMFLTWTPSILTVVKNETIVSVTFPPCNWNSDNNNYNYNNTSGIGCKYESSRLLKLVSMKLPLHIQKVIQEIYFDYEESESLFMLHEENKHLSDEEIACKWLLSNTSNWGHWNKEHEQNTKPTFYIGGIFPLSGKLYTSKSSMIAANLALDAIKKNQTILRDYDLQLHQSDGECKIDKVLAAFFNYFNSGLFSKLIGILGPACSDTVEPLIGVSKHFRVMVISYSAEGSNFSKYPYFFRTIGENQQFGNVYLNLMEKLGWKRLAALTEDGQKYTEYLTHMQDTMQARGFTFITNRKFPNNRINQTMRNYVEDLKNKSARIIVGDFHDEAARSVMCEAYHLGMTARNGYVWFLPNWLNTRWYDTDYHNVNKSKDEIIPCTTDHMLEAINGHFSIAHAYYGNDDDIMQENITVREWREKYVKAVEEENRHNLGGEGGNVTVSDYGGYAYDAAWTYALALDKLINLNYSYLTDIHSEESAKKYLEILRETDFHGVSGRIKFFGGPSRYSVVNVMQWYNKTDNIIGKFYPKILDEKMEAEDGEFHFTNNPILWLQDGRIPSDGTEPPHKCVLSSVAELLDVSCEAAVVIVNILGFGLLGLILIFAFIVIKNRYDKKLQESQRYMKSFGIDLLASNTTGLDKWEIPRDRVVINRKLGEGAFGTVYGGESYFDDKGWVAVAVKTLKVNSSTEQKLDFLSEAEVMKRLEHKNIVKLMGVCTKDEPMYTIMEFMLYGDLKTFLLARRHLVSNKSLHEESEEVSSKKLTAMALDVARGLSYLADLKYVHRDIACRNCLLNQSKVVKIGDFGMTRPMFENDYYKFNRKGMMPVRWMAPESLALGIFTPSSDVWSFGVLLYEIVTFGSFPFQGFSNNEVMELVKNGLTLTIPSGFKLQLESLMKSCWNLEFKKRPRASEIVEFLANNPRLLTPCLDVPLSSVQLENTGQLDLQLPDRMRKMSLSLGSRRNDAAASPDDAEHSPSPFHSEEPKQDNFFSNGDIPPLTNCPSEPLLGNQRSCSISVGLGRLVALPRSDSCTSLNETSAL